MKERIETWRVVHSLLASLSKFFFFFKFQTLAFENITERTSRAILISRAIISHSLFAKGKARRVAKSSWNSQVRGWLRIAWLDRLNSQAARIFAQSTTRRPRVREETRTEMFVVVSHDFGIGVIRLESSQHFNFRSQRNGRRNRAIACRWTFPSKTLYEILSSARAARETLISIIRRVSSTLRRMISDFWKLFSN